MRLTRSDEKLERLKPFGLDHGIDYTREDFVKRARELTGGAGPDLVVDSVGGKNLERSMHCAAYRGRVVARARPAGLHGQNKCLISYYQGAELFSTTQQVRARANVQRLINEAAEGRLQVVIDRKFKLSEAADAHAYIESRKQVGRVILIP